MHSVVWGLNEYKYQDGTTIALYGRNPFYPASRLAALAQAEDACTLLLDEGLITTELAKAYRFASDFALGLRQYEKALKYAFYERNIEQNIFGKEVGDLKMLGLASEQWIISIQLRMDENGIKLPGDKFWAEFPEKKPLWYDLRKVEKKRVADQAEYELCAEKKREKQREKNSKKSARAREKRAAALTARLQEAQEAQDQDEDKENAKDQMSVEGGSE